MFRGEPSMLFTKLEKVFFLRDRDPFPSSEFLLELGVASWICGSAVSIRGCKAEKLADCLSVCTPRGSGLVKWDCSVGGRRMAEADGVDVSWSAEEVVSSRTFSIPRASNGAPINSSELRLVKDKRPAREGREEWKAGWANS